ncbi:MAG: hypothetical protein NZ661_12415, partial [Candidatus Kapabacteria bacterium]|nr:hypothetical protein [Candidatus Kapabacteria bacterium]
MSKVSQTTVISLVLLIVIAYLPYILQGGSFMIDDWMMIAQSYFDQSIWKTFVYWNTVGGGGMRPLGCVFFAVTPTLFGENPIPYIVINTICWIAAILLVSRVCRNYCGIAAAYWFIAIAAVPTIASSTIFEPLVMIIGSASIVFWALSLWNIDQYMNSSKARSAKLIGAYALALLGLLIYEVSAPLLLIIALLPLAPRIAPHLEELLYTPQSLYARILSFFRFLCSREFLSELMRCTAPIVTVIAILSLFQKIIVPLYGVSLSRLSARPITKMVGSFGRWLFSVVVDTPIMLASSLTHYGWSLLKRWDWWLLLGGVALFIAAMRKLGQSNNNSITASTLQHTDDASQRTHKYTRGVEYYFLFVVALALLACSSLSVFSGFNMRIEGIENRFLGSTWICLAILLGALFARLQRGYTVVIPFVIITAIYFSFMIQAHNYIANRHLQESVIDDCVRKIQALPEPMQQGAFIIGNVPVYANNNFNNEVVFAYRHDFGGQLKMRLRSRTLLDEGQVVNVNRVAP